VGQQRELEKHMRADSLNEKISHRPKPEDLVKGGDIDRGSDESGGEDAGGE
jgi:hypothetical protein